MLSVILLFYVNEKESRPIYLLPPNPYSAKFIFISLSPEINGPAKAACVGLTHLQQSKESKQRLLQLPVIAMAGIRVAKGAV